MNKQNEERVMREIKRLVDDIYEIGKEDAWKEIQVLKQAIEVKAEERKDQK